MVGFTHLGRYEVDGEPYEAWQQDEVIQDSEDGYEVWDEVQRGERICMTPEI